MRFPIAARVAVVVLVLLSGCSDPDEPVENPPMINIYDSPDGKEVMELRSDNFMLRCTCPKKGPCKMECFAGEENILCPSDGPKCYQGAE